MLQIQPRMLELLSRSVALALLLNFTGTIGAEPAPRPSEVEKLAIEEMIIAGQASALWAKAKALPGEPSRRWVRENVARNLAEAF